jgi:hypothetical protein
MYIVSGNKDQGKYKGESEKSKSEKRGEMVLATLVYSPFNHLTWLLAVVYLN